MGFREVGFWEIGIQIWVQSFYLAVFIGKVKHVALEGALVDDNVKVILDDHDGTCSSRSDHIFVLVWFFVFSVLGETVGLQVIKNRPSIIHGKL